MAGSYSVGEESVRRRQPQGALFCWRSRLFAPCQSARWASLASYRLEGQSFGITLRNAGAGGVEGLRVIFADYSSPLLPTRLETRTKESNIYAIVIV